MREELTKIQCNSENVSTIPATNLYELNFGPPVFKLVPEGEYKVKLVEVEISRGKFDNEIFVFQFEIVEGQYKRCFVNNWINKPKRYCYSNTKLAKWANVLKGVNHDIFDVCDLNDLKGKLAIAKIEVKHNAGKKYNKIVEIGAINE